MSKEYESYSGILKNPNGTVDIWFRRGNRSAEYIRNLSPLDAVMIGCTLADKVEELVEHHDKFRIGDSI